MGGILFLTIAKLLLLLLLNMLEKGPHGGSRAISPRIPRSPRAGVAEAPPPLLPAIAGAKMRDILRVIKAKDEHVFRTAGKMVLNLNMGSFRDRHSCACLFIVSHGARTWASGKVVLIDVLAAVVNTVEHGGQLGMSRSSQFSFPLFFVRVEGISWG
jgi:hypothetical protein